MKVTVATKTFSNFSAVSIADGQSVNYRFDSSQEREAYLLAFSTQFKDIKRFEVTIPQRDADWLDEIYEAEQS